MYVYSKHRTCIDERDDRSLDIHHFEDCMCSSGSQDPTRRRFPGKCLISEILGSEGGLRAQLHGDIRQ